MARLSVTILQRSTGAVRIVPVPDTASENFTVGCSSLCQVLITGEGIESEHARIEWKGVHIFATPLAGSKVTALGKELTKTTRIDHNPLFIGDYEIRFET